MKNTQGTVIYVGKAKNLQKRLRQYFIPGGDTREMVPYLVASIAKIETIVVNSEKEALLLENNLIKKYKPKYNVLLRDDKSFIALKITNREKWPRVLFIRSRGRPKADGLYFGPYAHAGAARQTLDLLNKVFPLRQCSNEEFARRTRPCILYDMKRCVAPCVGKCTKEDYDEHVNRTIRFLRGQDKEVLNELDEEMHQFAKNLEFEKAAALQNTIKQIKKTIETQHVDKPFGLDIDALGLYREGDEIIISQMIFRGGSLVGSRNYDFSRIAQEDSDLLTSFILQHYGSLSDLPHEVITPVAIPESETLSDILSENQKRKVQINHPIRGEKKKLIEMAKNNASAIFKREKDADAILEKTLLEMKDKFKLKEFPKRIECFDNSNISGTEPVSTLVTFTDGKKDSSGYRKYKIRSTTIPDDYKALDEVLTRRYKRAKDENNVPDLIIVDGGKGHLNIALKVLSELNIITVSVIGVAKEKGRHDKGMTSEKVYLPNVKDPITFKKNSPILFLLQQIRDEAHRTAITFHRKRRTKSTLHSTLEDISGIGPAKRQALLRHFGSLKKIKEASLEEIQQVKGIGLNDARRILEFYKALS